MTVLADAAVGLGGFLLMWGLMSIAGGGALAALALASGDGAMLLGAGAFGTGVLGLHALLRAREERGL